MHKWMALIGLIFVGALVGCPSKNPPVSPGPVTVVEIATNPPTATNTATPIYSPTPTNTPTNTPTLTITFTFTSTPTATTCSIYGNHDSSPVSLVQLNLNDVVSNQITINKTTTITGFYFYASVPGPVGISGLFSSEGPTTNSGGVTVATVIGGGANFSWASPEGAQWFYEPYSGLPGYGSTVVAGNYLLTLQCIASDLYGASSGPISIGVNNSSCISYDLSGSQNTAGIAPGGGLFWNYLYGNPPNYQAATIGTTCYEMYITTCP